MRDELTDQQIKFYRENGYIIVENFLDRDELAEWCQCTDQAVAERLGNSIDFLTNQMNPEAFYAQVFTQCLRLADTHEGMRKLIHDPRIGRMGARWQASKVSESGTTKHSSNPRLATRPRGTLMFPTGLSTLAMPSPYGWHLTTRRLPTAVCGIFPVATKPHGSTTLVSVRTWLTCLRCTRNGKQLSQCPGHAPRVQSSGTTA